MKDNNQSNFVSRRNLIKYGGGFVGTSLLATVVGANLIQTQPAAAQSDLTPAQSLVKLMAGNKRFVQMKRSNPNQDIVRLQEVAKGQNPFAAVLSCADSRVPVEIIFDQGLGDVFVCRDAGNIATTETIGSLEFGTLVLGAKVLIVIGHESCGAVIATMKGGGVPGSIGSVLESIEPAVSKFKGQQDSKEAIKKATDANVLYQIERLKKSPVLAELIAQEKLKIVGAYYDLDTGEITLLS